ncbi:hypothetical protein D3C78_1730190 [compost metagenome]
MSPDNWFRACSNGLVSLLSMTLRHTSWLCGRLSMAVATARWLGVCAALARLRSLRASVSVTSLPSPPAVLTEASRNSRGLFTAANPPATAPALCLAIKV